MRPFSEIPSNQNFIKIVAHIFLHFFDRFPAQNIESIGQFWSFHYFFIIKQVIIRGKKDVGFETLIVSNYICKVRLKIGMIWQIQ